MKKQKKLVIAAATLLLFTGGFFIYNSQGTEQVRERPADVYQENTEGNEKPKLDIQKNPSKKITKKEQQQIKEIMGEESTVLGDLTGELLGNDSSNRLVGLLNENDNDVILNLANSKPKVPTSTVPDDSTPNIEKPTPEPPTIETPVIPPITDPIAPPINPPVIESVSEIHVANTGESVVEKYLPFDLTNYFYVTDALDPNPMIRIEGKVDIYSTGKQTVTVNVTNKFGNSTSKTLLFYVNARPGLKPIQLGTIPLQIDSNVSLYDMVHAFDEEDGDISGAIEIIKNTVDRSKEGLGVVEYKVTDSKGYSSFETVEFNVVNQAPRFTFDENDKHEINQPFNPLEGVTLNDREDGQLVVSEKMVISNTVDVTKEGTYTISYRTKDSHGKSSGVQKRIVKVENEAPVIQGVVNMTLHVKDELSESLLLENVTATDREDDKLGLEILVTLDMTEFDKIQMDTEGEYPLTYETTDSMDKQTTERMTVSVVNDAPEISGVRDHVTLEVGDSFDPMEGIAASDTETASQDLTIKIDGLTPEGTLDTSVAGTHNLTYSTVDEHGKSTEITSTVEVNEAKVSFIYPLEVIQSSSPMGDRINPLSLEKEFHRGHDFGANFGTDILAISDGVVIASAVHKSWGEYVVLKHANNYTSLYAHQSARHATVGQTVKQGDRIGLVGSTGDSTGPHLHLEVSTTGEWESNETSNLIDIDTLMP